MKRGSKKRDGIGNGEPFSGKWWGQGSRSPHSIPKRQLASKKFNG